MASNDHAVASAGPRLILREWLFLGDEDAHADEQFNTGLSGKERRCQEAGLMEGGKGAQETGEMGDGEKARGGTKTVVAQSKMVAHLLFSISRPRLCLPEARVFRAQARAPHHAPHNRGFARLTSPSLRADASRASVGRATAVNSEAPSPDLDETLDNAAWITV